MAGESGLLGVRLGNDGVGACYRRLSRTPVALPAALPDGLDDCAWQRGSAWQQCAFCVLDHAPDALHADRPLRPALPLRRRCYLKRFGYEIWRADRGQVRSRRLVHWVVVLGMYVDGVTDCVISWYPRLTRR